MYERVCTMVGGWAHVIPPPRGRSRESWEKTQPIESIHLLDATSLERDILQTYFCKSLSSCLQVFVVSANQDFLSKSTFMHCLTCHMFIFTLHFKHNVLDVGAVDFAKIEKLWLCSHCMPQCSVSVYCSDSSICLVVQPACCIELNMDVTQSIICTYIDAERKPVNLHADDKEDKAEGKESLIFQIMDFIIN